MRILILVDSFPPSINSGAKQMRELGMEFRRLGHEVTVLTPTQRASRALNVSIEDGLRVVRVETGTIKCKGKPMRALQEARLSRILWNKARQFLQNHPCDLIVFYSPTIFFGPLVRTLKALWRCPAYLILRDIFPQWAVDTGVLRKGPVWAYFRGKELKQYSAADIIAVQTTGDLRYFAKEFPANHYSLEVLYNWAALQVDNLRPTNYRAQLGLEGKVVFVYGGNIGVVQDMGNIIRLARNLQVQDRIHFLLVGQGSEVESLKRKIAAEELHNIGILPPLNQQEYLSMLSEFDVGLVTLDRRLKTHNLPGKILSYFYWGMPVLASVNPGNDLFEIIAAGQAGFCFENGEDERLAAAALRFAEESDLRASMGRNARRLLEKDFSVQRAAGQILAHLDDAVSDSRESLELQIPSVTEMSVKGQHLISDTFQKSPSEP